MDYIVKAYKDWKLHSQFHEIVPDMDDEYMFNEKQSIRESARSLKKYGSTCCNHIRNAETFIRHEIEKTDTLQGIALKYGCTTEQIRRANRLFASDSLFLRQFLLVPVEKSSPYYPTVLEENIVNSSSSSSNTPTSDIIAANTQHDHPLTNGGNSSETTPSTTSRTTLQSTNSDHALNENAQRPSHVLPTRPYSIAGEMSMFQSTMNDDGRVLNNHHHHHSGVSGGNCSGGHGNSNYNAASSSKQSKSLDSVVTTTTAMSPEEENRKCINDFLNKIDTTISESRKYVEKSKEMIASQSDDVLFITTDVVERPRRDNLNNSYKNYRVNQQNRMRQSSTGSSSDTAHLLNTTQTRHVQNRLSRLEKQQDEFFEL